MREFFYAFRSSAVFVGTVIGVGFATGEEIKVYFGSGSLFSVILSAFFFGVMSTIFMLFGKVEPLKVSKRMNKVASIIKIFVLMISFLAMTAGAEDILYFLTGFKGGGILTFFACYFILKNRYDNLKILNLVIVPIIFILLICVFIKVEYVYKNGKNEILSSFLYATMNVYSAGMIISEEGKKMSIKQIIMSSMFTTIIIGGLMVCIKLIVNFSFGEMPLLIASKNVGCGTIAGIMIYLAIFTTMLGDIVLIHPQLKNYFKKDVFVLSLFCVAIILAGVIGFSQIVERGYPIIGVCGAGYLVYAVLSLMLSRSKFLFKKSNKCVHSSGKST